MSLLNSEPNISLKEQHFPNIILYVDLDAFFASVEIREHPEYKDSPLIVTIGEPESLFGVVSTCNYAAREFGISSGMPLTKAVRLCSDVKIVKGSFKLYRNVSKNVMKILADVSPKIKKMSIDEAFIDISDRVSDFSEAYQIAKKLQADIFEKEHITCSIGVAPTKIIAKIASDFVKPNGITLVKPEAIKSFLAPLKLRKIPGVGPKTEKTFQDKGVQTCGDLAALSYKDVYFNFKKYGLKLWKLVNGFNTEQDDFNKNSQSNYKSISEEGTFYKEKNSWDEIIEEINSCIDSLIAKAKNNKISFRTIGLKIRNREFKTFTRSFSLQSYVNKKEQVKTIIRDLLKEFNNLPPQSIRLIGIKLSNLRKITSEQPSLTQFF